MERLVVIDTNVFVWAIKRQATAGQEAMIDKSRALLQWLWNNQFNVLIPTPVLGEALAPVPIEDHPAVLSQIDRLLQIIPFDLAASAKFAEMMRYYRQDKDLQAYKEEHAIPREVVKIDYMIAAIAVSRRAEYIYSEDKRLATFAAPFIEVRRVPDIPVQTQLFA